MKSSVATASKDLARIKLREADFHAFNLFGRVAPWSNERETVRDVVLYPAFDSPAAFGDTLNRLGWYFPEGTAEDLELVVSVDGDAREAEEHTPENQGDFDTDHLPLSNVDRSVVTDRAATADRLLLWDSDARLSTPAVRNAANTDVVDPEFYSHVEPVVWGQVSDAVRHGRDDRSKEVYRSLEMRADQWDTAHVFATGPSLDRAFEWEFPDDSLSVICNSIVRNDDLLDHLNPDVLTFADPVFHFGPSEYAVQFREDAVRAIREYDLVAIVPEFYARLLVGHHPDIKDQVVGMPLVQTEQPNFPQSDSFYAMQTANIMTMLMLPVASALTDHVRIVGADGRKEDESYFWEHSDIGQYDDELMNAAFLAHPAFFRDRVYTDYYDKHITRLSNILSYGERQHRAYKSLTPTHIQCLKERRAKNEL